MNRMLGKSPELQSVLRAARLVASTDVTTLILGESGTGKELLARTLHDESPRAGSPFIAVNCAALPEGLAESELFGHRRGAFTGAVDAHDGRIAAADGGTLFLDEVGELPAAVQAKLLRFLESGECQPLGATRPQAVDTRVVAATHRDLHEDVAAGRFRADLYYRLQVIPLELPALRERPSDIPALLSHFLETLAGQHGLPGPRLSCAARQCLEAYAWPGNVRELRNTCERLVILHAGQTIEPDHLPAALRTTGGAGNSFRLPAEGVRMDELEADLIRQALARTEGNRSRAARLLGLTRDTLLYRMKKYGLQEEIAGMQRTPLLSA
ncbi:regulatory Fis family protein [Alkalispirillum mobile]|uniref:Regulatory Fis family protein n=1 Tax=Alkalispirillum mobile TaxID=85925 RepID=A0A498C3N4_9GAMM|nr:sigma 54-interacting transcriptional regulator [Alkalispirillum mobile]RLK50275.1 regulatory Fis family protein [Alkalispirillum mobile]